MYIYKSNNESHIAYAICNDTRSKYATYLAHTHTKGMKQTNLVLISMHFNLYQCNSIFVCDETSYKRYNDTTNEDQLH